MLPLERGWCKSEFQAIPDTGSVKSRAAERPAAGVPGKTLRAARGERSVNVSLAARDVGDTGIEPVTSSV
jgi:hypothetical protein